MDVKLRDVIGSEAVLARLFGCRPAKASPSFRIAQIQRSLAGVFEDYGRAQAEILARHASESKEKPGLWTFAKMDDEGNPVLDDKGQPVIDMEKVAAYEEEHEELLEEPVPVEIKPLTLAILDALGLEPTLSPSEMLTIFWLIREAA